MANKPLADYVKLPELEEYSKWFKDFADLYREDGILLLVEDLKVHTVSEQYGTMLRVAAGDLGDQNSSQQDEKYISVLNDYRYATDFMQQPQSDKTWKEFHKAPLEWFAKVDKGEAVNPYAEKPAGEYKAYRPEPKDNK